MRLLPELMVGMAPVIRERSWRDAPELRALGEVCAAFIKAGPPGEAHTPEESARLAAYWTLYELRHVIDEIRRRTDAGEACHTAICAREPGRGRVVIDIAIEPDGAAGIVGQAPGPAPSAGY